MFDRSTYEIQVLMGDHWVYHAEHKREAKAVAEAKELVESSMFDGAQVVRLWKRSDGDETEKVVWSETAARPEAPVQIVPIKDAPACKDMEDFYGLESRMTIGRLLRKYLDRNSLTAIEMLYAPSPIRRFMDSDLYPPAVDRVATVQCENTDKETKVRRDEIYAILDQIASRAMRAEGRQSIRRCDSEDFKTLVKAAEDAVDMPDERDFLVTFILCQKTSLIQSPVGKIEWIFSSLPDQLSDADRAIVDNIIADAVPSSQVIQDMMGVQKNLAGAICSLLDLMDGEKCSHADACAETVERLRGMFKDKRLPATHTSLMDFIMRQIKGKGPLARNDPSKESDAFLQLIGRTFLPDRIVGGPAMADALLHRHARRQEQGGQTGLKAALDGIMAMLTEAGLRIRFLIALASNGDANLYTGMVSARLKGELDRANGINALCRPGMAPANKLRTVRALQDGLARCRLSDHERTAFIGALDKLAMDCLVQERVIETLDNKSEPLRVRAERLVRFCGSGILWEEGRTMAFARSQVVSYLRQPDFIREFTSGITDPKQMEAQVKNFYSLLSQSGFKT